MIDLSEDAACGVYRTLRGEATPLTPVIEQTRAARLRGERSEWRVPVTPRTVHRLEGLFLLARDEKATFRLGPVSELPERERAFLRDFTEHCLGAGVRRRAGKAAEVLAELGGLVWALPQLLGHHRLPEPDRLREVAIIGAYGGDHVGDAAILGGVLMTLCRRYGVTAARLLSHRPEHTRRLAAGLETPVQLMVEHYRPASARRVAAQADALVIAGGPLMDLPRVLAKHAVAAASARRHGKPLLVERVGIGPFHRRASAWLARLLLKQAASISTRSSKAATGPVARGLSVATGSDPAFDYLATRGVLNRLSEAESQSAANLLEGTAGRLVIGVNLRPIGPQGKVDSRRAEDHLLAQLAQAMHQLPKRINRPVTWIFFPMNPIQFGRSDLESAYRLHRLVEREVDIRIWEADPDVDGVLNLLRQLHMVLAMRFHACIFALSQQLPVIGADYYPGRGGKVEELFQDLGRPGDVRVMDKITAEWLLERFLYHAPKE